MQATFSQPTQDAPALGGDYIVVSGQALHADAAGALLHEASRTLIVADLHLEKGSAYAGRRVYLPPYDTAATLARLAALVARYAPRCVVALGDSFHDNGGSARLTAADRDGLRALQAGREWVWIAGNHDSEPPVVLEGVAMAELRIGGLVLRHEPVSGAAPGEIAGHLHPVARVRASMGTVRRRCFASDGDRCVLPAFGAYAGGLNIHDVAFASLFGARCVTAHALGRTRVFAVPKSRCLGD